MAKTMNQEILKQVRQMYRREKRNGKTAGEAMIIALESVPDTYGIGDVSRKYSCTVVYFANTGETYQTTVLAWHNFNTQRTQFRLGNWGDLVESGRYV